MTTPTQFARRARAALGAGIALTAMMFALAVPGAGAQTTVTVDLVSNGAQDGRVTATGAGASATANSTSTNNTSLRIGDFEFSFFGLFNLTDTGYRGFLSFPTNNIPANATVDAATLFISRGATTGAITANFGTPVFDIITGAYSANAALAAADFLAASTATGGTLAIGAADGSQTQNPLLGAALAAVNKSGGPDGGITQVKISYPALITNNDGNSDYIGFYPGNATVEANRPFLRVTYTIPGDQVLTATPGNVNFFDRDVTAGPSPEETVEIKNVSASTVVITDAQLTGADASSFEVTSVTGTLSLDPGSTLTLAVTFTAGLPVGPKNANITITADTGDPLNVALTGVATQRRISVDPTNVEFGIAIIQAGATFPRDLIITNSGGSDLTINEFTIDGTDADNFVVETDTGENVLAPGATRTLGITFNPNFPAALKTATLHIDSDAFDAPILDVPLTGTSASDGCREFGDFDCSGCTDVLDFLFLLDNWQLDFEGTPLGLVDFLALLDNWQLGLTCSV